MSACRTIQKARVQIRGLLLMLFCCLCLSCFTAFPAFQRHSHKSKQVSRAALRAASVCLNPFIEFRNAYFWVELTS